MADFSKPTISSLYVNYTDEINEKIQDLAVGLDPAVSTSTNIPVGAIRWVATNNRWEKFNGSSWSPLSSSYAITVAYTPSGSITATTVQAAIAELDGDITSLSSTIGTAKYDKTGGPITGSVTISGTGVVGGTTATPTGVLSVVAAGAPDLSTGRTTVPADTQSVMALTGYGYSTGTTWVLGGAINIQASQNWTSTATGTRIQFRNIINNTMTLREAMSIENTGEVRIPASALDNVANLNVGNLRVVSNSAVGYPAIGYNISAGNASNTFRFGGNDGATFIQFHAGGIGFVMNSNSPSAGGLITSLGLAYFTNTQATIYSPSLQVSVGVSTNGTIQVGDMAGERYGLFRQGDGTGGIYHYKAGGVGDNWMIYTAVDNSTNRAITAVHTPHQFYIAGTRVPKTTVSTSNPSGGVDGDVHYKVI
jgi:hypothetical protein